VIPYENLRKFVEILEDFVVDSISSSALEVFTDSFILVLGRININFGSIILCH
jgi:hypothetical protein